MTTEEHLEKIVAKCRELLAIAEKRTKGKWGNGDENNSHYEVCIGDSVANIERQSRFGLEMVYSREEMRANGDFIIKCAGPAEAGWRATIAAIGFIQFLKEYASSEPWLMSDVSRQGDAILAAWPEELLK